MVRLCPTRIAYINHDIDDAIRAGDAARGAIFRRCFGKNLAANRSERINTMVIDVVENSADAIAMSPQTAAAFDQLHAFLFRSVYRNPVAKGEESKAVLMLEQMYHYLCAHPELLPGEHESTAGSEGVDARGVRLHRRYDRPLCRQDISGDFCPPWMEPVSQHSTIMDKSRRGSYHPRLGRATV